MNLSIVIELYRSALRTIILAVAISIWSLLLVGCGIPLSLPDERPSDFPEESAVKPLIGHSWTEIVKQLGPPDYTTYRNGISYYLYETLRRDKALDLLFPLYVAEQGEAYCLLLEFGDDNLLRRYQFISHELPWEDSRIDTYKCTHVDDVAYYGSPNDWSSDWPLRELGRTIGPLSEDLKRTLKRAEEGDAEAQFQLYRAHSKLGFSRLAWLCRAADQEYVQAQVQVGDFFRHGWYPVEQDLTQAYLWYSLAARGDGRHLYESKLLAVKRVMTSDHIAEAERMLADWKPGQCELELVPYNPGK
jgi:hypothetical protein